MNRRENIEKACFVLGACLFAAGVFTNEWLLAALFSSDGVLAPSTRWEIRRFNLGCLFSGFVLMRYKYRLLDAASAFYRWFLRRRQTTFRIVSIVLPFLLLECLLRISGCYATYSERVGGRYTSAYNQTNQTPWIMDSGVMQTYTFSRPEFDFEVRTNSEGVRDIEHPVHKPDGEFRIVGLGDSFTKGFGAEFEDTYLKVLERRLNEASPGTRFRTISGGVSGSDPVFSYHLFTRRLVKYRPDVVILLINESDVWDIMTRGGMDRFGPDGIMKRVKAPRIEWLFAHSHLARGVLMSFLGYDYCLMRPETRTTAQRNAIPVFAEVAESFQELAERYGFVFIVVAQPHGWGFFEASVPGFSRLMQEAMSEKHILYTDLTGFFEEHVRKEEFFKEYKWPVDGHYNARGYDLLAQGVEHVLRARLGADEFPCH